MPSQRKPPQSGFLRKAGDQSWSIPIYGVDDMNFNRESVFDGETTITAPQIIQWKGDKIPKFNFRFKLVAGVTAKDRKQLFDYVKIAHALNAGSYEQKGPGTPPPPCEFALGDYVLCRGIVTSISAKVQGPWAGDDADENGVVSMNPTFATFDGEFWVVKGWESSGKSVSQIVNIDITKLSSNEIRSNFYKL